MLSLLQRPPSPHQTLPYACSRLTGAQSGSLIYLDVLPLAPPWDVWGSSKAEQSSDPSSRMKSLAISRGTRAWDCSRLAFPASFPSCKNAAKCARLWKDLPDQICIQHDVNICSAELPGLLFSLRGGRVYSECSTLGLEWSEAGITVKAGPQGALE